MPKFLEAKLKRQYGAKSDIPYKVMNSMGVMQGSKVTAKGRAMERVHDADMRKSRPHSNIRNPNGHAEKLQHS